MDIIKVIGVGIVGVIATVFLRDAGSEFKVFTCLATGLVILIIIINALGDVVLAFNEIVDRSGVNKKLFTGVLKIVGIGYITEYSSSICSDFGAGSIGNKIELAGKITIFLMAMPVVIALIDSVSSLVNL